MRSSGILATWPAQRVWAFISRIGIDGRPGVERTSVSGTLSGHRILRFYGDLQFYYFLHHVTNLRRSQIMLVFDLLDWNGNGEIGFDEFYMLVCIIMAHENHLEKQFIYRHSHAVFELLDIDGGHTVAPAEFQATRFLFNIRKTELSQIFKDFDISGDEQLNYKEFRMFTIFCIDRQQRKAKDKLKREMAKAAAEAEDGYGEFVRYKQD
ncbi:EF-hand calcium-binding domain-containing protein 9 isoform X1 [Erythrolamprus reginae]|uniref:EF-hand calcium-binding domain-containing protein 9 isoform X1 n=1 Tax=Erythrolamprus reginae TaxID=121349 RepID=UPI00396CEF50